jgi:hypothetical protein
VATDLGARTRQLQNAVTSLPGVRGARVQLDGSGVGFIRVLIAPDRDPQDMVRAVRAVARRRLGVELDPGRIQFISAGPVRLASPPSPRVQLAALTSERARDGFTARVTLVRGAEVFEGERTSAPMRAVELRAVSAAVTEAAQTALGALVEPKLVDIVEAGSERIALVALDYEKRTLIGGALVGIDENDAIARATLHALNRLLGRPG